MRAIGSLLLLLLAGVTCRAGVTSRDLFEPGDGLLTYDDVNQREWLDPSASTFVGAEDAARLLGFLSPGGDYEGFQFATLDDVRGLAESAGAPLDEEATSFLSSDPQSPTEIYELMEWNIEFSGGILSQLRLTYGLIATEVGEQFGGSRFDGTSVYFNHPSETPEVPGALNRPATRRTPEEFGGPVFLTSTAPILVGADSQPIRAYWLFRPAVAVPEPSAACLALVACLATLRLRAFA